MSVMDSYHPLLVKMLANRGITTPADAARFIKPDYSSDMHDPFLMHDMERSVVRIFEAIEAKQKIIIYADYDCDGIPGAVILYDLFKKIGYENFEVYIPDRHTEGYGLNIPAVDKFIASGVSLIVTIDLGTSNHAEIAQAESNGINVIVTDHHLPHETLPQAFAIVNPKIGDTYPEKMLCGAGVMFKLVQAFLQKYGEYFKVGNGWEKWLLDMAGLATLSDMVPLVGENRTIAFFGMHVLRKSPRAGLSQLLRLLKINQETLVEEDLTFMVTPRLNSASRMDSPMRAFELLSEKDVTRAGAVAEHLVNMNDERKRIVANIMKEVKHSLESRDLGPVIVIGNPGWRVGVLGIVAGKIMEEYDRPVFVWGREGTTDETVVKGSCRSNGAVNVVELMTLSADSFVDFGGHELAGGFSASSDAIHFLEEKLVGHFDSVKRENIATASLIDDELSLRDINEKNYALVASLSPFGLGNPKPTFMFRRVIIQKYKLFGKEKNHLEIIVGDGTGVERTAIAFFSDTNSFTKPVNEGEVIDLLATMEKSYFAGRTTLRLRITDIQ